jgi:uncharacterized membrane protein YkvA (DUF1232 family)
MTDDRNKDEDMNIESALTAQDESTAQEKSPGFWREVWQQIRLVFRLLRDPEVPLYLKIVPFLGLLYLLVPVDLIPDFVLGVGQIDDMMALIVGAKVFIELAPPHIVARHLHELSIQDGYGSVIEGEVVEDDELDDKIVIDPDTGDVFVQKDPEDLE